MAIAFPSFSSTFLADCCQAFSQRSKALSYRGMLSHAADMADDVEWLTVKFMPLLGPYIILQLTADHRVSLYLRSRRGHNRGKVLFAMDGMTVVGNGEKIVHLFEWTIDQSSAFHDGEPNQDLGDSIRREWGKAILRVFR